MFRNNLTILWLNSLGMMTPPPLKNVKTKFLIKSLWFFRPPPPPPHFWTMSKYREFYFEGFPSWETALVLLDGDVKTAHAQNRQVVEFFAPHGIKNNSDTMRQNKAKENIFFFKYPNFSDQLLQLQIVTHIFWKL